LRETVRGSRQLPSMLGRGASTKPIQRDSGMAVTGLVSGMAVHYAGCCHPLPGDTIVGIVTTGKGVTIHTRDCQTLEGFSATPERFIDVDWDYAAAVRGKLATYTGRLSVIAGNESSILADLANAVTRHEGSVSNLRIVNRQSDFIEILADVEVRDVRHLMTVIAGLRAVKGITQVERAEH